MLILLEAVFKQLFLKVRVATLGSRISEEILQVESGRILELEEEIQHHRQKIASAKAQASSQVRVLSSFSSTVTSILFYLITWILSAEHERLRASSDYAQVERRSVTFLDQTLSRGEAFGLKKSILTQST